MKYIIVETQYGTENAIIFDEILDHAAVAGQQKVVAAGFTSIKGLQDRYGSIDTETCCFGGSVTLSLGSRGREDARIIEKTLVNRL
jgi:hypothetical protein